MASLTETAVVTRKAIKYGAIGFVVISLVWSIGVAAIEYYKRLNPPPPPPPTMDFGPLPAIKFPKETGRPKLTLELPTGQMPAFPDRMRVLAAPTKRSGFSDADKAIETAAILGFIFKPNVVSEVKYVWTNQDKLSSRLEMDIISGHFKLTRNWQSNPAILASANFVSNQSVVAEVSNFLRKANLLPDDLLGEEKVTYLKAQGSELVPTVSLSEADFVQVDLFRKDLEEVNAKTKEVVASYSFYRPEPNKGLVRAIVSGSKDPGERIVYLDYQYTRVDYLRTGTYPIKTGDQAWKEFSEGGGFVADGLKRKGNLSVRRVMLGYYDNSEGQKYSMPIYVFLGDQGFTGYVSAVADEQIAK
ncbi:hypothetical protein HY333_01625 [Candidatus Collierbacteria bacterium]|nr:hypothetical protein [Candidatus Collierbacteria bacterium]